MRRWTTATSAETEGVRGSTEEEKMQALRRSSTSLGSPARKGSPFYSTYSEALTTAEVQVSNARALGDACVLARGLVVEPLWGRSLGLPTGGYYSSKNERRKAWEVVLSSVQEAAPSAVVPPGSSGWRQVSCVSLHYSRSFTFWTLLCVFLGGGIEVCDKINWEAHGGYWILFEFY